MFSQMFCLINGQNGFQQSAEYNTDFANKWKIQTVLNKLERHAANAHTHFVWCDEDYFCTVSFLSKGLAPWIWFSMIWLYLHWSSIIDFIRRLITFPLLFSRLFFFFCFSSTAALQQYHFWAQSSPFFFSFFSLKGNFSWVAPYWE